ncbi:hypothetical protein FRC03_010967 [Tulasnella sp. 419]|nr:hypothetical protein FRC03_010967 [Tulasnella sp. 419]
MSAGTLYTIPIQVQGARIKAVAAYGGVDIKLAEGYEHGTTNKSAEYKAKFPSGKIPALETPSGFSLFETSAIARYIASLAPNSTLLGSSPEEAASVDQWVSFVDSEIFIPARFAKWLCLGQIPYNKAVDTNLRDRVITAINVLESHLATRTYLVNERITLADISAASVLKHSFESIIDASLRQKIPNTVRLYNTITNHPKLVSSFGETNFAEKALQFTTPAKDKKEKAPKEAAAPKEKPAKPAKEADDDEDEPLVPEEPKAKNPLDSLPKSNFNLEEWKRAYSNLDTRGAGGSLEWFYER